MDLDELLQIMKRKAEGVNLTSPASANIVLDISGDSPQIWRVEVNGTKILVHEGDDPAIEPTLRVITSDAVLLKVATRQLNPTTAFFTGKIKIKGDIGLLAHLKRLWPDGD
jgi:putative sterol carrier protein